MVMLRLAESTKQCATRCGSCIRLLGEISLGKLAVRQDGRFCAVATSSNNVATSSEGEADANTAL